MAVLSDRGRGLQWFKTARKTNPEVLVQHHKLNVDLVLFTQIPHLKKKRQLILNIHNVHC